MKAEEIPAKRKAIDNFAQKLIALDRLPILNNSSGTASAAPGLDRVIHQLLNGARHLEQSLPTANQSPANPASPVPTPPANNPAQNIRTQTQLLGLAVDRGLILTFVMPRGARPSAIRQKLRQAGFSVEFVPSEKGEQVHIEIASAAGRSKDAPVVIDLDATEEATEKPNEEAREKISAKDKAAAGVLRGATEAPRENELKMAAPTTAFGEDLLDQESGKRERREQGGNESRPENNAPKEVEPENLILGFYDSMYRNESGMMSGKAGESIPNRLQIEDHTAEIIEPAAFGSDEGGDFDFGHEIIDVEILEEE